MSDRPPGEIEYAVLIPILPRAEGEAVVLTCRPASLRSYSGQVCLPGGRRGLGDTSLAATALREAQEEIGLSPQDVEVTRELGWHQTLLSHRVKAFVGRVLRPVTLRPNPSEVEALLYLPVASISPELFEVRGGWTAADGQRHVVHTFELEGREVWGLTARILREAFVGAP